MWTSRDFSDSLVKILHFAEAEKYTLRLSDLSGDTDQLTLGLNMLLKSYLRTFSIIAASPLTKMIFYYYVLEKQSKYFLLIVIALIIYSGISHMQYLFFWNLKAEEAGGKWDPLTQLFLEGSELTHVYSETHLSALSMALSFLCSQAQNPFGFAVSKTLLSKPKAWGELSTLHHYFGLGKENYAVLFFKVVLKAVQMK